jgi:hypothetical protein
LVKDKHEVAGLQSAMRTDHEFQKYAAEQAQPRKSAPNCSHVATPCIKDADQDAISSVPSDLPSFCVNCYQVFNYG